MIRKRPESTSARRRRLLSSYSQLLRHYFSREGPGIFAANSSSTASTILLLLQTTTTQHLFGIHPSIHLVLVGRKREAGQPFPMDIFLFVEFFNAAHVISSVFIR
jgi:hypothetical protein